MISISKAVLIGMLMYVTSATAIAASNNDEPPTSPVDCKEQGVLTLKSNDGFYCIKVDPNAMKVRIN